MRRILKLPGASVAIKHMFICRWATSLHAGDTCRWSVHHIRVGGNVDILTMSLKLFLKLAALQARLKKLLAELLLSPLSLKRGRNILHEQGFVVFFRGFLSPFSNLFILTLQERNFGFS
jgi:hypothetical protein